MKMINLTKDQFFIRKIQDKKKYSVVAMGDSRVLSNICPPVMEDILNPITVYNYGFPQAVWSKRYWDGTLAHLNTDIKPQILLLGVTPVSLTQAHQKSSWFEYYVSLKEAAILKILNTDHLMDGFSSLLNPELEKNRLYTESGWSTAERFPTDVMMKDMKNKLKRHCLSQVVSLNLLKQVQTYSNQGILIIGFRSPTSPSMLAMENELTNFDEIEFGKKFEGAGGHWLNFDEENYTYDDLSHMDKKSAIKFSRDLAIKIKNML